MRTSCRDLKGWSRKSLQYLPAVVSVWVSENGVRNNGKKAQVCLSVLSSVSVMFCLFVE